MAAETVQSLPVHRLDTETYAQIVASGALDEEHVELLDGLIVDMSPQGPEHMSVVRRLISHFAGGPGCLQVQDRLEIPPYGSPEPDIALLAEEPLAGEVPRSALLVVEVAVSSHLRDRNVKSRVYAHAGIPTYWIVDAKPGKVVEVRTDPGPENYRRCDIYGMGAQVPSPAPGVADLDVSWLLERANA